MDEGLSGFLRGNLVIFDGTTWRLPNGVDAKATALICPRCTARHEPDQPDACLGLIQDAAGACCGHGLHLGYVNWEGIGVGPDWRHGAYIGR